MKLSFNVIKGGSGVRGPMGANGPKGPSVSI